MNITFERFARALVAAMVASASPALLLPVPVVARECHVDLSAKNLVKFISDSPFEDFEGVTEKIDGYAYWDGDSLSSGENFPGSKLYFEVALDALDTGIGLRNSDMRDDYLETDKYPRAMYDAAITRIEKLDNGMFRAYADGTMTIHGVANHLPVIADIAADGDSYRVQTAFSVLLPDYKIKVPKLLFLRISEKIDLKLDFYLIAVK